MNMKKIYTIKNNSVFTRMYAKAASCVLPTVVVYAKKNKRLTHPEIGITVGKKLGGAVQRNRARRLIKEAWRLLNNEVEGLSRQPFYIVIVARSLCFKKKTKMQAVKKDLHYSLKSLRIIDSEEK